MRPMYVSVSFLCLLSCSLFVFLFLCWCMFLCFQVLFLVIFLCFELPFPRLSLLSLYVPRRHCLSGVVHNQVRSTLVLRVFILSLLSSLPPSNVWLFDIGLSIIYSFRFLLPNFNQIALPYLQIIVTFFIFIFILSSFYSSYLVLIIAHTQTRDDAYIECRVFPRALVLIHLCVCYG